MNSCLLWGVLGWWGYKNSASFESVEIGIEMLVFVVGCDLCEWKKVKKKVGSLFSFFFLFYFILSYTCCGIAIGIYYTMNSFGVTTCSYNKF